MIVANIKNAERYLPLSKNFAEAFEFLKNLNKDCEPGSYEGDGFRVNIMTIEASDKSADGTKKLIEAHKNYVDIQYCISGSEGIGYAHTESLSPLTEYDKERDIVLLCGDTTKLILNEGDFCILFPEDAHAPGMIGTSGTPLKKAVVKIKI